MCPRPGNGNPSPKGAGFATVSVAGKWGKEKLYTLVKLAMYSTGLQKLNCHCLFFCIRLGLKWKDFFLQNKKKFKGLQNTGKGDQEMQDGVMFIKKIMLF